MGAAAAVVVVPLRRPAVCFLAPLTKEHGDRRRNRLGLGVKRREEREVDLKLERKHCGGGGGSGGVVVVRVRMIRGWCGDG